MSMLNVLLSMGAHIRLFAWLLVMIDLFRDEIQRLYEVCTMDGGESLRKAYNKPKKATVPYVL
jgi:hypothetical protein